MKITVTHTTEVVSGKEYPLTITKQIGEQEIEIDGELVQVAELTIFESPLGRSRCYTRARPERTPEECATGRRRIQEIATQAMIEQGIW